MASTESAKSVSMLAGSDLRTDLFKVVRITAANTVDLVTDPIQTAIGLVGEAVNIGETVPVVLLSGRIKVLAGAAISVGELLIADATSRVVGIADIDTLGVNEMAIGVALEDAAAAGDVIEMLGMPITSAASA